MTSTDIPPAALRLAGKAAQHGWTTRIRSGAGRWLNRDYNSLGVLLQRDTVRLVALWEQPITDSLPEAWRFRRALRQQPMALLNSRELVDIITSEPS